MPRWLCVVLLLALATSSEAQETKATLGKLPEVYVLTALKSGDWDDLDDLAAEALDEVNDLADERDIKLIKTEVLIFEMFGLKNFRARIGYHRDDQLYYGDMDGNDTKVEVYGPLR